MRERTLQTYTLDGAAYSLHYKLWGENANRTLVCVHALTGNSDDFKPLGEKLATNGWRVAAIDMAGRGLSDYYPDAALYNFDQYMTDLGFFLDEIGCTAPNSCAWLGVSMGGLLGLRLAGHSNSPVANLILSDIGPEVPQADLDFISMMIKLAPEYNNPADAIPTLKRSIGTPYARGLLSEDQWLYLAQSCLKQRPSDGKYIRNFDPNIAPMFDKEPLGTVNLWDCWGHIHQPVLALRGALSTLFPIQTLDKMLATKSGHPLTHHTIKDCGHVPSLYEDDQIELIANWLPDHRLS